MYFCYFVDRTRRHCSAVTSSFREDSYTCYFRPSGQWPRLPRTWHSTHLDLRTTYAVGRTSCGWSCTTGCSLRATSYRTNGTGSAVCACRWSRPAFTYAEYSHLSGVVPTSTEFYVLRLRCTVSDVCCPCEPLRAAGCRSRVCRLAGPGPRWGQPKISSVASTTHENLT